MAKKTRKRFDISDTNNGYVTLYDEYDKSAGYIIEKGNEYWTGKNWSDIKAYAESYKTKKEAEQKLKSTNMADGGEVLYMVSRRGNPEYPEYIIERTDGSEMIQMFFDTEEDAIKYAKAKGYNLSKKNIMAKKTRKRYDTGGNVQPKLVKFDSMYDGLVDAYESVNEKDTYFYVSGEQGQYVVTQESKGFPASEAYDDWLYSYEDALNIAKKLALGEDLYEFADGGMMPKRGKFISNVGYIDDFELKSLLQKNSVVKTILGTKEKEFLNNSNTHIIGVSGKNYDFIVTDGEKEFEFSIHKKGRLIKPLRPARPEIVSHYKMADGGMMADGGYNSDKYIVEQDKDGSYKVMNTERGMYVDYSFKTKADAEDFKRANDFQRKKFGRESYFADGGMMADGGENFDFIKSSIESASGDKISHIEYDDYDEKIYCSTKNPYVNYYIGGDEQIIKYDGKTGKRYPIGELKHYMADGGMAKGGRVKKYELGDMWSPNFNYNGMLKMGINARITWGLEKLQALSDSFEDVNYHTENIKLIEAIDLLKKGDEAKARQALGTFNLRCRTALARTDIDSMTLTQMQHDEAQLKREQGFAKGGKVELIFHGSSREIPMGEFESSAAAKRYVEASDWQRPYSIKKLSKRNKFEEEVYGQNKNYAKGGGISDAAYKRRMKMFGHKPYGATKGKFKVTYNADGEPQTEIWDSMEMAKDSAKRYSRIDEFSDVKIFDESGKEIQFMARGGEPKPSLIPDYSKISGVVVEGIDTNDAPDFVDAYIADAYYDGEPMTDEQLEELNYDGDFVYSAVERHLYADGGKVRQSKKDKLWESIKNKFSEIFYLRQFVSNEIFSNDVTAEKNEYLYFASAWVTTTLSFEEAENKFIKMLTDDEKKMIKIERNVKDINEAFGLMSEKKILVKRIDKMADGGKVDVKNLTYPKFEVSKPEFDAGFGKGKFKIPDMWEVGGFRFDKEKDADAFYDKLKGIDNMSDYLEVKIKRINDIVPKKYISKDYQKSEVGKPYYFSSFQKAKKGERFLFTYMNSGVERDADFVFDKVVLGYAIGWLNINGDWIYGDYIYDFEGYASIGSGASKLTLVKTMADGGMTEGKKKRTIKLTLSDKDSYDYTYKQDGTTASITFGFGKEPFEYEVKNISKSLEPLQQDILETFTLQGIKQHDYKGGYSEAIKHLDTAILQNAGKITKNDIISGAKFKTSNGTIFIIDKVNEIKDGYQAVESSIEGGQKGNYRDDINDLVMFLNEEQSEKMAKGDITNGIQFDRNRNGSLYDRGRADSYYGRAREPHWYPDGTYQGEMITELTNREIEEYNKGYDENTDYKDYGEMAKGGKVKSRWIQEALSGNKGELRKTAKRKGLIKGDEKLSKTDLNKLQKMGGKTAKRARLAETLIEFKK